MLEFSHLASAPFPLIKQRLRSAVTTRSAGEDTFCSTSILQWPVKIKQADPFRSGLGSHPKDNDNLEDQNRRGEVTASHAHTLALAGTARSSPLSDASQIS